MHLDQLLSLCPLPGWFQLGSVYGETLKNEPLSFTGITLHKKIIQSMLNRAKQQQNTAVTFAFHRKDLQGGSMLRVTWLF